MSLRVQPCILCGIVTIFGCFAAVAGALGAHRTGPGMRAQPLVEIAASGDGVLAVGAGARWVHPSSSSSKCSSPRSPDREATPAHEGSVADSEHL